jgi:hypothetical protein
MALKLTLVLQILHYKPTWKNKDAQTCCKLILNIGDRPMCESIENIEGKLGQIESYLSTNECS